MSAEKATTDDLLDTSDASLLELVDHLLNKGVVITGDVVIGLANVDLVYLKLSAVLCTPDRMIDTGKAGR